MKRKPWSPTRREVARQVALLHPEWAARGRATYAARYPDRVAVYEAVIAAIKDGSIQPQPCDCCGAEAKPRFTLNPYALSHWRCDACKKAHATD